MERQVEDTEFLQITNEVLQEYKILLFYHSIILITCSTIYSIIIFRKSNIKILNVSLYSSDSINLSDNLHTEDQSGTGNIFLIVSIIIPREVTSIIHGSLYKISAFY